jgi:hypothetical protein
VWLLLVFAAIGLSFKESGCKRQVAEDGFREATEAKSTDFLIKKLKGHNRKDIKRINAQGRMHVEGSGQSVAATYNLIWVRDSAVWLNVKKFGLEAVRALITPDSVFVLNRLDKTYTAKGVESLQRQYSLPAGFELLQSLLLAEPWFSKDISLESEIKDGLHRLSGANGRYAADYRIEEGNFRLRQETFVQPKDARTMSVSFEKYKKNGQSGWFPYLRTVEAYSPDTGDLRVSIEFNEAEFNVPKSIRFDIPKHYERTE